MLNADIGCGLGGGGGRENGREKPEITYSSILLSISPIGYRPTYMARLGIGILKKNIIEQDIQIEILEKF